MTDESKGTLIFTLESEGAKFLGFLSADRMKLFLRAEPASPPLPVARDAVLKLLSAHLPTDHVDLGVLADVCERVSKGETVEERRIAKGVPADDGADGKILLLVRKYTGALEVTEEGGTLKSLAELDLFENITEGQIIGRLYPPKSGKDGRDALGGKIPSKVGKPTKIALDKSLKLEKDPAGYEVVKAQTHGLLREDSGKLRIDSVLSIAGNVDFHYGNIDFIGAVDVQGDVLAGFHVRGRDGVTIRGSVSSGSLESALGDITVRGHVFGGPQSRIVAGGTFKARVVQEINAEVQHDIIIERESTDSKLRCEGGIVAGDAVISGGEMKVSRGVEGKEIGRPAGTSTSILLCSGIETRTEYQKLAIDLESHDKALALIELHLGPLVKNPSRIQVLQDPHRAKMQQLLEKHSQVHESKIKLLSKKAKMLEGAAVAENQRVNVRKMLHEGVKVQAQKALYLAKEPTKGPISLFFRAEPNILEFGEYQELELQHAKEKKK